MPGSTPSRCLRNCHASLVPMSERQQLKLVRQLEITDGQGGNLGCLKERSPQRGRSRSCNCRGETPLHKAAIKGDEEMIIKLLQEGADPNIPDFAGWTPLHEACNHGWYRVALALIEAGALVNARGLDDDTPLHDAAVNGHSRLVQLLVERGADVNARNKGGKTPSDVAASGLMTHLFHSDGNFASYMNIFKNPRSADSGQVVTYMKILDMVHRNGFSVCSQIILNRERSLMAESVLRMRTTPPPALKRLRQRYKPKVRDIIDSGDTKPRGVSKFQHLRKKSAGKSVLQGAVGSPNSLQFSMTMDEKSNKEDVYEFKSSKEATPVRGTSVSPEADKSNTEPKNEKAGDGNSASETTETSSVKRTLTDVTENDENEDETKRKKRKEGDGKVREEAATSSKALNSSGRTNTVRNTNNGSEKGVKVPLCKNSGGVSKTVMSGSGVSVNSDRKSPGSPKSTVTPTQHLSANVQPNSVPKMESEQEDKSIGEGEKMDQGPKVPPLKIVIPQQTASEPEQGNRNGKNGNSRHHQALPYVVSSNSNDGEKEGLRSRSASPIDSFKSDEKKDPAIGMLSAEDQKGSLHHQRVLRSANRSGPNANEGRSADVSVSRGAGGQSTGGNNTNVALPASSNNANGGATISSSENPSPQSQNRASPLPQVDCNSSTSVTPALPSSDGTAVIQNSSNYRASSTTPSKTTGSSSNPTTTSNYDDKGSEINSESNQTPTQVAVTNPAPVELHPRKRKLKHNKEIKESPLPQVTAERCESATTTEVHPHEQPVKNCYQLFLDIRKQIERRRKGLFPVQPKPPQGFKDYLMNRCTYVLAGNASTRQIPTSPLPQNLPSPMKDLFSEQEKERHRLRLQHVIEKEKLVLSVEQEILRVHGRAARALANQSLPFSACTILKDEEVYNLITPEQEEKDRNARSRYNGRLFLSWLQDVDDKWEKIKEAMLLRHHNEAESLHAVQKMDWDWKMKELESCEFKSKPVILENHVPMVHVSDDFDLLPA